MSTVELRLNELIDACKNKKETTLSKFKVIAWMPMPEPYKENENE